MMFKKLFQLSYAVNCFYILILWNCMDYSFPIFRTYLHNVDTDREGNCPWRAVLESVRNSVTVRPLKVLWRTQLNPPRFSHEALDWPTENNSFIENW